jgi:hypothetical protein
MIAGTRRHSSPQRHAATADSSGNSTTCTAAAAAAAAAAAEAASTEIGTADWSTVDHVSATSAAASLKLSVTALYEGVVSSEPADLAAFFATALQLLDGLSVQLGWPARSYALWRASAVQQWHTATAPVTAVSASASSTSGRGCALALYARVVGRLSLLWTASCGVIETAALMRGREALLQQLLLTDPAVADAACNAGAAASTMTDQVSL